MWLRLARPPYRIASTLFALMALVAIGFVTSPASFAQASASLTLVFEVGETPADDHAASPANAHSSEPSSPPADEPHSLDALAVHPWHPATRPGTSFRQARTSPRLTPVLGGPDRPPPRAHPAFRSEASEIV